jgi:hypothetical protein
MDISQLVILCLETFQAGYGTDKQLVAINWTAWEKARTPEIRCVFFPNASGFICCDVHPTFSWTNGTEVFTGRTWSLDD